MPADDITPAEAFARTRRHSHDPASAPEEPMPRDANTALIGALHERGMGRDFYRDGDTFIIGQDRARAVPHIAFIGPDGRIYVRAKGDEYAARHFSTPDAAADHIAHIFGKHP